MRRMLPMAGIALLLGFFCLACINRHKSPEVRKMDRLIRALQQSPDDEIVDYAAERLGRSQSRLAIDALLSALNNAPSRNRQYIARGLGFVNDNRATPALLQALREGDYDLQHAASVALARRRDPQSIPALLSLLKDSTTRRHGICALYRMRNPRVFAELRDAMKDSSWDTRNTAAWAVALSGDPGAKEALYSVLGSDDAIKNFDVESLALMPYGAGIPALVKAFQKADPALNDLLMRAFYAFDSIGEKPEALVNVLLGTLKSGPVKLRCWAADALRLFEDDRVIDALIQETANSDPQIRGCALRSLYHMQSARTDSFFLTLAKNRSSDLHGTGVEAICERADPRNAMLIAEFLKERDKTLQIRAAAALAAISDPLTIPALDAAARISDAPVILLALGMSLAKAGAPRAVEILGQVLDEGNLSLEAASALVGLKHPHAREILVEEYEKNPRMRSQLIDVLGKSNDTFFFRILIRGLKDKDPKVRLAAANALQIPPDPAAADILLACLDNPDSSVAIPALIKALESPAAAGAAKALGEIGDRRSVPALLKALKGLSPRVSRASAEALGSLKDRSAVDPLIEALSYEHCSVREAAAQALGEIGDSKAIPALAGRLSDGRIRESVTKALSNYQWRPHTDRERIYILLNGNKWDEIMAEWPTSRAVLLSDLKSRDPDRVEGASIFLIAIGADDTLTELKETLKTMGTLRMAMAYYNSRHPVLGNAAIQWAFENGMSFLALRRGLNIAGEDSRLLWGRRNLNDAADKWNRCPLPKT